MVRHHNKVRTDMREHQGHRDFGRALHARARAAFARAALLGLMGLACLAGPAGAEELRREVLDQLRQATFEVVLEKPTQDPLGYEKELPFDLLPFQVRNDKYDSIGTAFALGKGQYVSAAHVIYLQSDAVRRRIHLRDADGRIIDLDRVLKYSGEKDFVVFSVKDYRSAHELEPQTVPRRNDAVFSVGNALGQGVITRDGLYTSDTPEEERGRWQWLRFSAAASPGNSGGPLVDRDGRVLGVVLRKSQNENLNYALPITEVLKASERKGQVQSRSIYKLDITARTLQNDVDLSLDLPSDYRRFGEQLQSAYADFALASSKKFMAAHKDALFPAAAGAEALLYRTNEEANFPNMLVQQDDGGWDSMLPKERRNADIGKNGYVVSGAMGNYLYVRVQAPDDVPAARLQDDSRLFMDLILKGVYYTRNFGAERIRITSLGAAREQAVHVDGYGRKWQVRRWFVPHTGQKVVTYALPVPGGFSVLLNSATDDASFMYEVDQKILTDFVFVTYYGTLKQWQEFLARKDMLPAAFGAIALDANYGKELRFRSARMSFSYPDSLMKITPNSDLHLRFSYFKDNGKVVWDVTSVVAGEDRDTNVFVSYSRYLRPPESLPDADRAGWKTLVEARAPYNGSAYMDKSRSLIGTAHAPGGQRVDANSPLLYGIVHAVEGTQDPAAMAQRLAQLRAGFQADR
jgi:serine protease Do